MVRALRQLMSNVDAVAKLEKLGITTGRDLLEANIIQLLGTLDLSLKDINKIIDEVSNNLLGYNFVVNCGQVYEEYVQSSNFISSSYKTLDNALCGGFPIGTITEICGIAGVGKTQLCMGTVIQAIVSGAKRVLYYDTEGKFDPERFKTIAINKFPERFDSTINISAPHLLDSLYSKVEVRKPLTSDELNNDIMSKETDDFIVDNSISLIVIDSIASLFRTESGDEHFKEVKLVRPASKLKEIASKARIVVLVTNQISHVDAHLKDPNKFGDIYQQGDIKLRPLLGPTWAHCVSCRIIMGGEVTNFLLSDEKTIKIVKSQIAANSTIQYKISDSGITSLF